MTDRSDYWAQSTSGIRTDRFVYGRRRGRPLKRHEPEALSPVDVDRSREFRRAEFRGAEWEELLMDGWLTMCVSSTGVALMTRRRT